MLVVFFCALFGTLEMVFGAASARFCVCRTLKQKAVDVVLGKAHTALMHTVATLAECHGSYAVILRDDHIALFATVDKRYVHRIPTCADGHNLGNV